jgi:hypothetical protein
LPGGAFSVGWDTEKPFAVLVLLLLGGAVEADLLAVSEDVAAVSVLVTPSANFVGFVGDDDDVSYFGGHLT